MSDKQWKVTGAEEFEPGPGFKFVTGRLHRSYKVLYYAHKVCYLCKEPFERTEHTLGGYRLWYCKCGAVEVQTVKNALTEAYDVLVQR